MIYHAHFTKLVAEANKIELALYLGGEYGCRDMNCPCCKYIVYDSVLNTTDITIIVKSAIRSEITK